MPLHAAQPDAVAELALDIHFGRGLGEREERWPEAGPRGRREEAVREVDQRRLEIDERDPLVHREPFDLAEDRRVRRVEGVVPVHDAGDDHAIRAAASSSMVRICTGEVWVRRSSRPAGSPSRGCIDIERVVHVHRRMVGRKVEREEVVPLGLDLGADRDGEPERAEDLDDLVDDAGDGMLGADPAAAAPAW